MGEFHLFLLEWKRLFKKRITWLCVIVTILSPLAGLTLYRPLVSTSTTDYVTTMLGIHLANPALAGGVVGSILFALLTVTELHYTHRNQMDILINTIISPLTAAIIKLMVLLCTAVITQAITMLIWLPYTIYMTGSVFDGKTYVMAYLLFMFAALPLAILFTAAIYQITERFDLSLILFAAFAGLSLTVWKSQWQLCWLNPCVWAISDDFSNNRLFRMVAYMRGTWLLTLSGLWGLSYLCIRRYGKTIWESILWNIRRFYRLPIALFLLFCSAVVYSHQPFLDHSKEFIDYDSYYTIDYLETVIYLERYAQVRPDPETGCLYGMAVYQIQNNSNKEQILEFTGQPGYKISSVQANEIEIPFTVEKENEMNDMQFQVLLPADRDIELKICYGGFPREWNILSTMQGGMEISERYMELENEVLAPNPHNFLPDSICSAIMDIILPSQMTPILFGSGTTTLLSENDDGTKTWRMKNTRTSMIIYAGDYVWEDMEAGGITVHFYYGRKHKEIMEAARAKEAIQQVIEYCTNHYGPLNFYNNGSLKLIQSRVSGGGYAAGGSSMLDEIDFTAQNLSNSEKGSAAGEVIIHELVHQWWGLGNMFDPEIESTEWSAEGLTVYTTYRIAKELYGEAYARTNYIDQWQHAVDEYQKNFYVRHPEYLSILPVQYQADIANSLAGMLHYSMMPLKILKAEQLVGGEEAMDQILYNLFNREIDHSYPYLTYQDFLDTCGLTEEELTLD